MLQNGKESSPTYSASSEFICSSQSCLNISEFGLRGHILDTRPVIYEKSWYDPNYTSLRLIVLDTVLAFSMQLRYLPSEPGAILI